MTQFNKDDICTKCKMPADVHGEPVELGIHQGTWVVRPCPDSSLPAIVRVDDPWDDYAALEPSGGMTQLFDSYV